jgi:hypothetical protein
VSDYLLHPFSHHFLILSKTFQIPRNLEINIFPVPTDLPAAEAAFFLGSSESLNELKVVLPLGILVPW